MSKTWTMYYPFEANRSWDGCGEDEPIHKQTLLHLSDDIPSGPYYKLQITIIEEEPTYYYERPRPPAIIRFINALRAAWFYGSNAFHNVKRTGRWEEAHRKPSEQQTQKG